MTEFLIDRFLRSKDGSDCNLRTRGGFLSSILNLVCNAALFAVKLAAGLFSGSIAVVTDAVNNLSDGVSSLVTLAGFRLAAQPADKEHPFGHGRYEYISGLAVAFLIMLMGIEFGKSSIARILAPEPVTFHPLIVAALIVAILVKLWMAHFNRRMGNRIGSVAMEASAADSRNDVLVTSVTLLSFVFARFTSFPLDGAVGLLVSVFVLYSGFSIAKSTISPLLGEAPDPAVIEGIRTVILAQEPISGVHEIAVHNYGPGKSIASAHAEMTSICDIVTAHTAIDHAEQIIRHEFGIEIVIHLDPIPQHDAKDKGEA